MRKQLRDNYGDEVRDATREKKSMEEKRVKEKKREER